MEKLFFYFLFFNRNFRLDPLPLSKESGSNLFFQYVNMFFVFVFLMFLFGFSLFLCFPACCTVRSTGFARTKECICFFSAECHQREKTILHLFQGNLHKGMLHCPQENNGLFKKQLLIEEYLFKIMLDFLQGILFMFK